MANKEVLEYPERIYFTKAKRAIEFIKFSHLDEREADDDIEYILKDSFVEIHKLNEEEMSAIRQDATKYVRGFWETHHQAIKDFSHVKDSPQYKPMFDLIFQDLIQAIKKDLGGE